jgi:hypothetical protein
MLNSGAIQLAVSEHFSISTEELTNHCSKRAVALPRQIAMYIAKCSTDASLPEIGRRFGGKHHTTVMHSIAKVCELKRVDSALDRCVRTPFKRTGTGTAPASWSASSWIPKGGVQRQYRTDHVDIARQDSTRLTTEGVYSAAS